MRNETIVDVGVDGDVEQAVLDRYGKASQAREEALREMVHAAKARGADAVIGVDIDYEVLGKTGGMLMVTAAGTAVKIR